MADPWTLAYDTWDPEQEPAREALCALGNGSFATRAAAEECAAGGVHYPGTYLAGGYDRLPSEVDGWKVEPAALVNWPSWLPLTFRAAGGPWFCVDDVALEAFRQELRLRDGELVRALRCRDRDGRTTALTCRRLVSMADPGLAAIAWQLEPLDWHGDLVVRSGIDGDVVNAGVARYRGLRGDHVEVVATGVAGNVAFLEACARRSRLRVGIAARTTVSVDGAAAGEPLDVSGARDAAVDWRVTCPRGGRVTVEKVCALASSRERTVVRPARDARIAAAAAPAYAPAAAAHRRAWHRLWRHCDIRVEGDDESQRAIRLFAFHLLQSVSQHDADLDVGVPARGLHGEVYHGHVFWDDLFLFPFYDLRLPDTARGLLMYRYRRLGRARHRARAVGARGALFPWRSATEGWEETPVAQRNPRDGRWVPDHTHLQRHVNAAIAYNAWHYVCATDDGELLSRHGAELIVEIARCFADLAVARPDGRFSIPGVVGPDEFHTAYPDADEPGLRDNAYTNVMAAWTLRCAGRALDRLPRWRRAELCETLDVDGAEPARWAELATRLYVPFFGDGLIEQFDGYRELEELDWDRYRARYGDLSRVDWILLAEDDTPNRYKVSKQADALMLLYVFPLGELQELLGAMGYSLSSEAAQRTIDYYRARTTHGSSLSRIVDTWLRARQDRERAWPQLRALVHEGVDHAHSDSTREGIHLGAMAGSIDLVQRCCAGVQLGERALWLDPHVPAGIDSVDLPLRYRGAWLEVHARRGELEVSVLDRGAGVTPIGVDGMIHELSPGETRRFARPK